MLHFLLPGPFERMVPSRLGHTRELVYLSGAAELAAAGLVAYPRTRGFGGTVAALVFVAVFPANVSMALNTSLPPTVHRAAILRLPLQVPLVLWALRVGRRNAHPSR